MVEFSIGVDLENVSRLRKHGLNEDHFWRNILTRKEIRLLKKYRDPFPHAAGIFCAKEAIRKALSPLGIKISFLGLEIKDHPEGYPEARITKGKNIKCKISISHTNDLAMAVAFCEKKWVRKI